MEPFDNSAAQREQSQARLNYAEPARNLDTKYHNGQLAVTKTITSTKTKNAHFFVSFRCNARNLLEDYTIRPHETLRDPSALRFVGTL